MSIQRLDHINLRTGQLDRMVAWYGEILDMHPGPRPDFGFPGAWLYANGQALVHLVGVDPAPPQPGDDLTLEHGAFSATDFAGMIARLEAQGERFKVVEVPGFPIVQVNVWDPDGNHLHIDYNVSEMT